MKAVVLASGAGARMGGPKALLPWHGTALALAHARALLEADVAEVYVVARGPVAHALHARCDLRGPVTFVVSEEPDAHGMAGSLRAFAKLYGVATDTVYVLTPVDALPVRAETLHALAEAHGPPWRGDSLPRATRPVHADRGGHPVLVDGAVLDAFRGEASPPTLRDVLRAMGPNTVALPVDDPRVLADLDTPEDVARWK